VGVGENEVDSNGTISPGPTEGDATPNDSSSDYQTLAQGFLTPRHRRLCQLAAEGRTNAQISEELGYSQSRTSILLKNHFIIEEVRRLQDRLFEETIQARLKSFAEPALNNIHMILTDRTNRVKISEKAEMSKWVVEKLDGKATQKTDIGENLLGVLLDRLDAKRAASPRDVASSPDLLIEARPHDAPSEAPSDPLSEWVQAFNASKE